ncbi:hypothetical protein H257_08769 [Aphanomyces astaci]|uniref:Uncharacterized protein n=1 Tax=Aphanomyces astaci TaxID=112090 RepID=W4GEC7_APHAT|nr:hypothetical protein H257_08769 [Aphanomyces astaci]ETV77323.1 hypothetical protein H257_08769 [Aphanomyces astaci]|eukprot:XP_009833110.1 hypothetical protein H257_08769 [Aphanomyces astaci]
MTTTTTADDAVTPVPPTAMSVWRETDWVPSRSMADKDTDEYEASFLQGKRKKILIVFAAALVVVGTAIGVIVATSTETADASQASGVSSSSTTIAPVSTPSTIAGGSGELLVGSTGGAVVSEVDHWQLYLGQRYHGHNEL